MADSTTDPHAQLPLRPHVFEILMALDEGPAHGYAIIKQVEAQTDGTVTLGTSSLYSALKQMATAGLVEDAGEQPALDSGGPPRRYFGITELGLQVGRLEARRLREAAARADGRFAAAPIDGEASS